jgi:hypothetical protein
MNSSVIVWDLETVPDLQGFAAANELVGKRQGKDRIRLSQRKWIEAAILEGVAIESLLIVEWAFSVVDKGTQNGEGWDKT